MLSFLTCFYWENGETIRFPHMLLFVLLIQAVHKLILMIENIIFILSKLVDFLYRNLLFYIDFLCLMKRSFQGLM